MSLVNRDKPVAYRRLSTAAVQKSIQTDKKSAAQGFLSVETLIFLTSPVPNDNAPHLHCDHYIIFFAPTLPLSAKFSSTN
jgi:hypothetical protein